jgi:hypothetical protein
MDGSSQPAIILTTKMSEQPRPLRRKISHQSTPVFSSFLQASSSGSGGGFINKFV